MKHRSREHIIAINAASRKWLKALYGLFRNVKTYESNNDIFSQPISILQQCEAIIFELDGQLQFKFIEEQFFMNDLWIKPILSERQNIFALSDHFKRHFLGGIMVQNRTSREDWTGLVSVLKKIPDIDETFAQTFNNFASQQRIETLMFLPPFQIDESPLELPLHPSLFSAVINYLKLYFALKDYADSGDIEEKVAVLRRIQRVTCELIDLVQKHPRLMLLMTLSQADNQYAFCHPINAMLMSVCQGFFAKRTKNELLDFAVAILLHDVGRYMNDYETTSQPDKTHPEKGVKEFFRLGYLQRNIDLRAKIALSHHYFRTKQGYPQFRDTIPLGPFVELASINIFYDALISNSYGRQCATPHDAIRCLLSKTSTNRYTGEISKLFSQFMGPLPVGSWVQLTDQQKEGMVVASGYLATQYPYPDIFCPDTNELICSQKKIKILPGRVIAPASLIGRAVKHHAQFFENPCEWQIPK
ncbi:MAG: hypothetical protein KDD48_03645 [Bdellovibrionales bacterium]|nr:hypothetical protein [Bdellovibrionales bacterium]